METVQKKSTDFRKEVYKIKKVKQVANDVIRAMFQGFSEAGKEAGIGDFTVLPNAFRVHTASKNANGEYNTGLSVEEEKFYGRILGKDLSRRSDFWKDCRVTLNHPKGPIEFNEANPQDVIRMKLAIDSGYLAPSLAALKEQKAKYGGTVFYLYEEEEENARKRRHLELKDSITATIYNMRNDQEKMLLICFMLNINSNEHYSVDTLYAKLSEYKEGLTSIEMLEEANKIFTKNPIELQAYYYFSKAGALLQHDYDSDLYSYEGRDLGIGKSAAIAFLIEPVNQSMLAHIIKSYKELKKSKK